MSVWQTEGLHGVGECARSMARSACGAVACCGDTAPLLEKLRADAIDAAIITLPINDQQLLVMNICEDSLVVCLPENHPLASKVAIAPADLQGRLKIFRQPEQHPDAHERLVELLGEIGIASIS